MRKFMTLQLLCFISFVILAKKMKPRSNADVTGLQVI